MIYSYIAADNCYIIYQKQTILLPYFYLIKNMTICVINNGISPSTYISRRAWLGKVYYWMLSNEIGYRVNKERRKMIR